MSTQQDIDAIRAQQLANTHDPLALMANTQTPFHPDHSSLITYPQPNNNFVPQPSFNTNYMQQPMQHLKDISDPTTAINMTLALMAKAFTLNSTTATNNNQRSSSNPRNMQIAQPDMNMDQDRQMLMVEDNTVENMNGLSVVSGIANQHGNGNVVRARLCRIAQKEEARIQSTQEEFDFMTAAEAAKFVRDFKSLAKEADESLVKQLGIGHQNKGTNVVNTRLAKQSILGKPHSSSRPKLYAVTPLPKSTNFPKVGETNALSKPVTSNSVPSSRKSTVVNNERVIAPGIFRINPFKASRVDNFVPNKHVKASVRTKLVTVSQPHVVTKEDVNSNRNGFSPNNVESTTMTRRPQVRNNPKNDKVYFKSKSSCLLNKLEKIEENHRSLQSSIYPDHTSSECNNIKLAIRNENFEVICATCKQCLITVNHDECVIQYVNGMKSRTKNQSANVSKSANQRKHKPRVWKPKKVGSKERLASPKPSTPRSCLRWSPTGRMFDLKGKIIATSESVCQSDCSKGDNACTSNPQEPINKRFPSLTFSMTGCQNWLDTLLIPLLSEYKPKDKENHGDNECDS
ncbi:hypothetical protein Tco_0534863 [Tanacetum coccineum]